MNKDDTVTVSTNVLSLDAIMSTRLELKHVDVHIEQLGGSIRLRELNAWEREQWERAADDNVTNARFYASLVVACAVNLNGAPLFTSKETIDVVSLWPTSVVRKLYDAAIALNNIRAAVQDTAKKT
jgi:hypothetical protein